MRSPPSTQALFSRVQTVPALVPQPNTPYSDSATTPDFLLIGQTLYCYLGAVQEGHERIAVLLVPPERLCPPVQLSGIPAEIAVDVGAHGMIDCEHVMDPASILTEKGVFLYYSALGLGPDSICLAISADGITFIKHPRRIGFGRAPGIVYHKRLFYLFYVKETIAQGYAIHMATSTNGVDFQESSGQPVLDCGGVGAWDSFSVTTPRIFARGGWFYMLYAGDNATRDLPKGFGLARSCDLVEWVRYPHNPVFLRGDSRSWDNGAIWFGSVFEWNDLLYLFYEGTSQAALTAGTNVSAVGVATLAGGEFDWQMAHWSK